MAEKATAAAPFSLAGKYQTADEIESGCWFTLSSGLLVLIARGGSPEFYKVAARAGKKFGKGKDREVPGERQLDTLIWVMARANFKAFKTPAGDEEVEVVLGKDKELVKDSAAGRERLLTIYPDLRDEVIELAGMTAEEFQAEIEDAGKD